MGCQPHSFTSIKRDHSSTPSQWYYATYQLSIIIILLWTSCKIMWNLFS